MSRISLIGVILIACLCPPCVQALDAPLQDYVKSLRSLDNIRSSYDVLDVESGSICESAVISAFKKAMRFDHEFFFPDKKTGRRTGKPTRGIRTFLSSDLFQYFNPDIDRLSVRRGWNNEKGFVPNTGGCPMIYLGVSFLSWVDNIPRDENLSTLTLFDDDFIERKIKALSITGQQTDDRFSMVFDVKSVDLECLKQTGEMRHVSQGNKYRVIFERLACIASRPWVITRHDLCAPDLSILFSYMFHYSPSTLGANLQIPVIDAVSIDYMDKRPPQPWMRRTKWETGIFKNVEELEIDPDSAREIMDANTKMRIETGK